jgi:phosphatidylglycerol:prolipoprotein diacylglycerol transferase
VHPVIVYVPAAIAAAIAGAVGGALAGARIARAALPKVKPAIVAGVLAVALAVAGYFIAAPRGWNPLPIYSYGVMLGTSLIVAWYIIMYLGTRKEGMSREVMANCFITTALCAIAGSRLLFIVTNPQEFENPAQWLNLREGGLVAYGGFLGGLLGSWIYLRSKDASLAAWADIAAPTLGTGLGFTRIGCYLFGCDFGAPLGRNAPAWLAHLGTFPGRGGGIGGHGSPAYEWHVAHYDLASSAHASLPVHPTQLYESALGFLLFGVAMLVWQRRRFRGQVMLIVTLLYATWRFFIEYVRDDPERGQYFGFSTSQWISLALLPIAGFLYFELRKRQSEPLSSASGEAPADAAKGTESPKKKTGAVVKRKKRKRA